MMSGIRELKTTAGRACWCMALIVTVAGCAGRTDRGYVAAHDEERLRVEISSGSEYSRLHWFGIIPFNVTPQIAVWAETPEGSFVRTLFVTKKAAHDSWAGGKDLERPEALPVFFAVSGASPGSSELEAVSGATPKAGREGRTATVAGGPLKPGRYVVYAEVNSSFDYNDSFPETDTDVNGQPSLIYRGELTVTDDEGYVELSLSGKSDRDGDSVRIDRDLHDITGARDILRSITVRMDGKPAGIRRTPQSGTRPERNSTVPAKIMKIKLAFRP